MNLRAASVMARPALPISLFALLVAGCGLTTDLSAYGSDQAPTATDGGEAGAGGGSGGLGSGGLESDASADGDNGEAGSGGGAGFGGGPETLDDCTPNPCVHGTCSDGVNSYSCNCDAGWTGTRCNTNSDDCNPSPCVHGTCSDGVNSYSCSCDAGWSGAKCNTNIDDCTPNPCVHGTCSDGVNSYSCVCDEGWAGTTCDQNVHEASNLTGTATIAGTHDTWNNAANWEPGVIPSGNWSAVVSEGIVAGVDRDGTPAFSGGLLLKANAKLTVGFVNTYAANANALGTGPIILREGSVLIARAGVGNYDFAQGITLEGNATIQAGASTTNHWTSKNFSGGLRGAGRLTYNGVNGTWFRFNTPNPLWTGGLQTGDPQNQQHAVEGQADGCFGTGDVSINNNCTLVIASALGDTIDDSATLSLNGAKAGFQASKLILNSSETVRALFLDGVAMPAGKYTNLESWLSGQGVLTVLSGP